MYSNYVFFISSKDRCSVYLKSNDSATDPTEEKIVFQISGFVRTLSGRFIEYYNNFRSTCDLFVSAMAAWSSSRVFANLMGHTQIFCRRTVFSCFSEITGSCVLN